MPHEHDESLFDATGQPTEFARLTDPSEATVAGDNVTQTEGRHGTIKPGSVRHQVLTVFAASTIPLTDDEAGDLAGFDPPESARRRVSDLLAYGVITKIDKRRSTVHTSREKRTCVISAVGRAALAQLATGAPWTAAP